MSASTPTLAGKADLPMLLRALRRQPLTYAWAIQDLEQWPDASRLHFMEPVGDDVDFLLVSGHPANRRPTLILGGAVERAPALLTRLPPAPWLIKETSAHLLPAVRLAAPSAAVYLEHRMDVARPDFRPQVVAGVMTRRLTADDATRLMHFHGKTGSPMEYTFWLRGAVVYGAFAGDQLAAIASSVARIAEGWELGAVETLAAFRGKGFGTAVTSALTAAALEAVPAASLTVRQDNEAALKLYGKLGYGKREARIWVDNGTGAAP